MHDVYVYVRTYATLLTFHLVMHIQFFIAYMFGKHPEHMWLIYLVEGMYMLPRKFYNMIRAKPMNQGEKGYSYVFCIPTILLSNLILIILYLFDISSVLLGLLLVHEFHSLICCWVSSICWASNT